MDLSIEKKEKLLRLLSAPNLSSRRAHIVSSHYDPDSLACIWMLKLIFELYVKCANVYLPGKPDNFLQNAEIVSKFGLTDHIMQINTDFLKRVQPEDIIVFVDTPACKDSRFPIEMPKPHILIDHHARPDNMTEDDNCWYWYGNCGACISMVTKLGIELDAFKNFEEVDIKKAATLGILGVLGDSKKLTSRHTKPIDYEMAAFLSHYADQDKIYNVSFSAYDETLLYAMGVEDKRWKRNGSVIVYRMEDGSEGNLPKFAELLMMFAEIKTVFVWSLSGDRVVVKARNSNPEYNLDNELKRMFGQTNGGAKDSASGAAVVKFDFFNDCLPENKEDLLRVCDGIIRRKIFGK